ncbi:endonuclease/exonuclease/phosphatase family protein [Telluribacter sp.]|jgi:endonuclease/exonuclease/phosphatase family metal-dependent hydrolase|uniref:endonuclease/exonuclease/phosphatase family protein n=1 Tax=Telluribacter sp. TaxID=1978767 RepID=UPI002E0D32BE|nr:endonuclease/exonuclease/phosphatase family protein [Telluribacter sp.]
MKAFIFLISTLIAFTLPDANGQGGASATPANLKVMTYNIHHCNPPSEEVKIDVAAIARVINQEKPDLVALQEVDIRTTRSGKNLDQARELARLTGMYSFFTKALDHQGGDYGVAVLSKYPILDSVGYLLPRNPELGGEDRAIAAITVQLPNNQKILFASTHLDLKEGNRLSEAELITKYFKETRLPMILAGDFNDIPGSRTINYLDKYFTRTCQTNCQGTIPIENPNRTIDFVMTNSVGNVKALSTRVINEQYASDHLPVVVEFTVR